MTDHANSRAARAPRTQEETTLRDGHQRTRRKGIADRASFDRDLAELEALMAGELQNAESPSIAANDDDGSEPAAPDVEANAPVHDKPAARPRTADQPRRERRAPPRAENLNDETENEHAPMHAFDKPRMPRIEPIVAPAHPYDLDQYAKPQAPARRRKPAPELRPTNDRAPLHARPRDAQQHAQITRALRFGATVFSLVALVGVSALLVLLAVGADRSALPTKQAEVAATTVAPPAAAERDNAPAVTGSTETKSDASRVASIGQPPARGTVRAVDARETSARIPQVAAAPAAAEAATGQAAAFQPERASAPAAQQSSPSAFSAPPAFERSADEPSAEPRAMAAAPATRGAAPVATAATRSVPVTSHVNLRATADNNAAVVGVVPAGKNVDVVECKGWCEVVYNDQKGFIHKRFLKE